MTTCFLIFPNQLFSDIQQLSNKYDYYLLEDPRFFGYDINNKLLYNFNKLKLVLHKASMQYFYDYFPHKNKHYVPFNSLLNGYKNMFKKYSTIIFYDPINKGLVKYLEEELKGKKIEILESPNFLTTTNELEQYHSRSISYKFFHKSFYDWQKKRMHITIRKSYDTENRRKIPDNLQIPHLSSLPKTDKYYINSAKSYIEKHFPNNYGNTDLIYPITYSSTKEWLKKFIHERFSNFGHYQDAIKQGEQFTFHSVLSPMLNIGLINPIDIIHAILPYRTRVGLNNYEGFLRQIIGWREYQRYIYLYLGDEIISKNYFNNNGKINHRWYEGTTGIEPVDDAIKDAFKYGYLHHIRRLMVMCNFMNLCEIKPFDVYKWFMEFSVDSYEWVMIGNVYSMGLYADGGLTMRKPYLSTDNYIMQMSDYKLGEWNEIWKCLFYRFLIQNRKQMQKTPFVNNIIYFEKQTKKKQNEMLDIANKFIKMIHK